MPEGAAVRPDGSSEPDPSEVIANRAGIAPFGGELAHKGFALALIVELLAAALAPVEGHAACVLLARPRSQPAAGDAPGAPGRRFPGDAGARAAEPRSSAARSIWTTSSGTGWTVPRTLTALAATSSIAATEIVESSAIRSSRRGSAASSPSG